MQDVVIMHCVLIYNVELRAPSTNECVDTQTKEISVGAAAAAGGDAAVA
jgi:hypothetical protein